MSQIAHAERSHALLSASGASRWLACPPSARLEATLPDTESEAAKKGTLAHEMAELKMRKQFVEPMGVKKFNAAMKKFKEDPLYEPDMDTNTTAYLEYVQGIVHGFSSPPYVTIERRVDLTAYVPEAFGTADCIVIGGKQLYIIDYKNGQGKSVSADDNPQLKLYALGALEAYSLLYEIETVHVAIVQPKVWDRPSEWSIPAVDLLWWGDSIKSIARQAFAGEGEYSPGDHCGFCRAKDTCRARIDRIFSVEPLAPLKPPLISWEEVGDVMQRAGDLVSWFNSLKKLALQHAINGGELPGWKVVAGRGSREYSDLDAAFAHLVASGIDEALLYVRQPLTPPALEKELGKKQYKELLEVPGLVVSVPGAPTLAAADDNRPVFSGSVRPEDVFKVED